jgi:protein-L-isoaspartate(D-aspartate) O-methyltransferase
VTQSPSQAGGVSPYAEAMMAFVLRLRSQGMTDQRVLNAVSALPRPLFVMPEHASLAWGDHRLPLPCGQTITPPSVVATVAERLLLEPHHRVLEVGTGSGYMTAVLARLTKRVHTIDRWRTLVSEAEQRLRAVEILNVTMMVGDGSGGWAGEGPFDRIVVTAGVPDVPPDLLEQLADSGCLCAPVGPPGGRFRLTLLRKDGAELQSSTFGTVRASPLVKGVAEQL